MFHRRVLFLPLLFTLSAHAATPAEAPGFKPLSPARVTEIERMLPDEPAGLGPPITDREAWQKLAQLPGYKKVLKSADKILGEPIPDQPDDLYLLYSKTGDRDQWQKVAFDRRSRFNTLVLAECLTSDGRYLPKILDYLHALCDEPTWTLPAHDGKLENFHGKTHDIDLGDAMLSFQIATAWHLLGEKLPQADRKLILDNLTLRTIDPFRERYTGKKPLWFWMPGTNNWNAVCLAGTVGTALAVVPDKHTRAEFIAAAELYSQNFLNGFPADGYCTEGLGYWNYGFGHFVFLSETIRQATSGKLDLLARKEAALPAQFGPRIMMTPTIAPAFADCPIDAKPAHPLMVYLNHYFGLGLKSYDTLDTAGEPKDLYAEMIYRFSIPSDPGPAKATLATPRLRDFFDKAGILLSRPAPDSPCKLAVALKGGNNNEHHNHNDIGSFVVTLVGSDKPLLLDPGPERYTARTFSPKRYDSKLLNSFGHSVPVVAGQLQRTGAAAQAKIIKSDLTDSADTFAIDFTSAYEVPALKSLTRTWTYSRTGAGSLTMVDRAQFSSPQDFAGALITLAKFTQQPDGSLLIDDGKNALLITIKSSSPLTITSEEIKENAPVTPTHIALTLKEKSATPFIQLTITPKP